MRRMPAKPRRPRRAWHWALAFVALCGVVFGIWGYTVAASFSVANAADYERWRRAAVRFLVITGGWYRVAIPPGRRCRHQWTVPRGAVRPGGIAT